MLVKVCGMRNPKNIKDLIQTNIDLIGFIFFKGSKRYVQKIPVSIPEHIKKVGVFVNESVEEIKRIAEENALDYIQLHGDESAEFCKSIKDADYEVIKAFRINDDFNFGILKEYEGQCDVFLFDTKGKLYGGTGMKFNWELLGKYKGHSPFLLSGGISSDDVKEVLAFNHKAFAGIDINSGFETEPGLKNVSKVNDFIKKVKQ